jgi:hypothetical protein
LLGITRASSNSGTAAALASPLAAEDAIQGSGVVLQPCGSAVADQQLLQMQGSETASRDGRCGPDVVGKDSCMV